MINPRTEPDNNEPDEPEAPDEPQPQPTPEPIPEDNEPQQEAVIIWHTENFFQEARLTDPSTASVRIRIENPGEQLDDCLFRVRVNRLDRNRDVLSRRDTILFRRRPVDLPANRRASIRANIGIPEAPGRLEILLAANCSQRIIPVREQP